MDTTDSGIASDREDGRLSRRGGGAAEVVRARDVAAVLVMALSFWVSLRALLTIAAFPHAASLRLGVGFWPIVTILGLAAAGAAWGLGGLLAAIGRSGRVHNAAIALRLWLVVGVLGGLGYVLTTRYDPFTATAALGVVAGLQALACRVLSRSERELSRGAVRWLDVSLFNVCLVLVAAELTLHLASLMSPSVIFDRGDDSAAETVARTRSKAGKLRFGFPMNSQRFYDEEFVRRDDGFVVLSIADSFSVPPVPHYFHFTTVAERALDRTQIYNMGVPAIGPSEYLHLLMTEGLALDPDAILVNLFVGNDLTVSPRPPPAGDLVGRWLDRDNLLLWLVPRRLRTLAREGGGRDQTGLLADALETEALDQGPAELLNRFPWLGDPFLEEPLLGPEEHFRVERRAAIRLSRQPRPEYVSNLAPVRAMAEASGESPFLVVLIPAAYQVDDDLWRRISASTDVALDRDKPQEILRSWLGVRDIPYLDLLPEFRRVSPLSDGRLHLYHRHDTHINRRGNDVAGRALAGFLAANLGLDGSRESNGPQVEDSRAVAGSKATTDSSRSGRDVVSP